jgi:hypothetical protein
MWKWVDPALIAKDEKRRERLEGLFSLPGECEAKIWPPGNAV